MASGVQNQNEGTAGDGLHHFVLALDFLDQVLVKCTDFLFSVNGDNLASGVENQNEGSGDALHHLVLVY